MSNVPLPEPAFSLRWERGEHKVSPPMDDCDCYTADQMHAYAAAVSAAKDAEISRLKHRIALHDPCNGRMAGEPPRYTPECVVLRADVAGLREQVQHLQSLLVDADNICKEHGGCDLQDCIDNDGDLYQSQAMADALDAARKGEA